MSESASGKTRGKNLIATKKDVWRALLNKQPCILVRFRQNYLSLSDINENLPSVFQCLLKDYEDVFSEAPKGLPPLQGDVIRPRLIESFHKVARSSTRSSWSCQNWVI